MPEWFVRLGYVFLSALMIGFLLCGTIIVIAVITVSIKEWKRRMR